MAKMWDFGLGGGMTGLSHHADFQTSLAALKDSSTVLRLARELARRGSAACARREHVKAMREAKR